MYWRAKRKAALYSGYAPLLRTDDCDCVNWFRHRVGANSRSSLGAFSRHHRESEWRSDLGSNRCAWLSTDAVRGQFVDACNMLPPAPAAGGRGAKADARGGPPTAAGARGARGARGTAPTPGPAAPAPNTPDRSLAQTLSSAESVGYLWTSESTGYSLRYAYRLAQPDGSERIMLVTDRRLGDRDESWKPVSGPASEYDFSVIELRAERKARRRREGFGDG